MEPSPYTPIPLPDYKEIEDSTSETASREFLQVMKGRHSVCHYAKRPVARVIIENAIATVRAGPSGANQQPWHFVAIQDSEMKLRIRAAAEAEEQAFMQAAAVMNGYRPWSRLVQPPINRT